MSAQPPITSARVGRRKIIAAITCSAALAAVGCNGGGDDAGPTSPRTVTVTAGTPTTSAAQSTTPGAPPPGAGSTVVDPNADLSIDDQFGAGRRVRVEDVVISTGTGHVAIYAASGRLLGAGTVGPTVRRTTIRLSDPVPRTSELLGVLYGDDGDSKFSPADPRVVDEDGELRDDTFDYRLLR